MKQLTDKEFVKLEVAYNRVQNINVASQEDITKLRAVLIDAGYSVDMMEEMLSAAKRLLRAGYIERDYQENK